MASTSSPIPSDKRLDEAVGALASAEDDVGVIRVVEMWASHGTPTAMAKLAAARAFYRLRMMDRATMRVREILDASPGDVEALTLLVRIYLDRDWKERARGPLAELSAAGSVEAAQLSALAAQPFTPPEARARQVEREAGTAELIELAERFCATGSFTRASGILERVRRQDPRNPRAEALLWGLAGDLSAGPPIAEVLARAIPSLTLPLEELPEEPEHTESVDASDRARMLAELGEEAGERNFPSLFKSAEVDAHDDDVGERTVATGMATRDEMVRGNEDDEDARVVSLTGGGDTQILLVLRPGEDAQSHRRRAESDRRRETFNLREYQASMGVAPAPDMGDADGLEEEDESIVLLARAESPVVAPAVAASPGPIEVVERHPARPMVQQAPPEPPPAPPPRPPEPARRAIHPLWFGAVLLVIFVVVLASLALALPALLARTHGNGRAELMRALGTDDFTTLQKAESAVSAHDDPAELAELELVIWSEFNGDPARLARARQLLDSARLDTHRRAMLSAEIELAMGNPRGAAAAVGLETPRDDEERLLESRIALAGDGGADRANDVLADLENPGAPRYRLGRAEALAAAGLIAPALALIHDVLRSSPSHARGCLLELAVTPGAPDAAIAAFAADPSVPTRFSSAATAIRVRALLQTRDDAHAVALAREGLLRDGQNVDLHLVVADGLRSQGHLLAALGELQSISTFDERVWTATVLTLLDLDRLDEADAAVTARSTTSPDRAQTLRALVAASGGRSEAVPDGESSLLRASARALADVQARAPDASDRVAAAVALAIPAGPGSGFEVALQQRVRDVGIELVPASELPVAGKALLACCGSDPYAHLSLARAYEQAGERVLASQHFDRAVTLGPELAQAWYERGRFYEDAGPEADGTSRSAQSWHNYLALAPSGPNAARVASRVATTRIP